MTKREALAAVPMFRELRAEVLDEILSLCVERTLVRGETLFAEGDQSTGLHVIWRGLLKVYKLGEGGREQILLPCRDERGFVDQASQRGARRERAFQAAIARRDSLDEFAVG